MFKRNKFTIVDCYRDMQVELASPEKITRLLLGRCIHEIQQMARCITHNEQAQRDKSYTRIKEILSFIAGSISTDAPTGLRFTKNLERCILQIDRAHYLKDVTFIQPILDFLVPVYETFAQKVSISNAREDNSSEDVYV